MNSLLRSAIISLCRFGYVIAVCASDSFDKINDSTTDILIGNANEMAREPHSGARLRKDVNRIVRQRPGFAHDFLRRKKPTDVDAQQFGDLEQPARRDTVCPLLIFLNL